MHYQYASEYKNAFFYFLTVWVLSLQVVYHVLSIGNSFAPAPAINLRVKITWFLYNLVANSVLIVAMLYWLLDYDPDNKITFNVFSPHGATAVVAVVEGLVVNRIPIRFHHWWVSVVPFQLVYTGWTILHSVVFDLGNPNHSDEDDETNDDAIYPALDWVGDAVGATILIAIVVLVLGPLLQLILFSLSFRSRGYMEENAKNGSTENFDHSAEDCDDMFELSPY